MIIRAEQLSVFEARAEEDFTTRLVNHLRQTHASVWVRMRAATSRLADLSDDKLRALVHGGIERGRKLGLMWQSTLAIYVTLQFVAAPNFDQHPEVARQLHDADFPPDVRMKTVYEQTSDKAWKEIRAGYDPRSWPAGA